MGSFQNTSTNPYIFPMSRLLLNIWHSNDPEPKVHFFAHAPRDAHASRCMNAQNRTGRLESTIPNRNSVRKPFLFT